MKKIEMYRGKKVLVLGLAKSGHGASLLLNELGANVIVNDKQDLSANPLAAELQQNGVQVISGHHPVDILSQGIDLVVKNPGIPYHNPMLVAAKEQNIPIVTEVELAYLVSEAPMIGITGSNGKTTTTTIIFEMLKNAGKSPLIAGNIGTVACEVAKNAPKDSVIVTELSSFQLMGTEKFHPYISVFLNLFDAHLDYHSSKNEYALAKANVFKNQTKDEYAVINLDDKEVVALAEGTEATIVPFSMKQVLKTGAYLANDILYFNGEKIIDRKDIVLPGIHNIQNILASICVTKLMGVSNEAIVRVLTTFTGVKHRTQYVTSVSGRKFYNDSKATNILATQAALSAFIQPVILLAGGLDRGNEFHELVPFLAHVKALVTFGETANKLEQTAQVAGVSTIKKVDDLESAVGEAFKLSDEGDVILLSPACASWDQFKTFEERGDMFIQAVNKLV